MTIPKTIKVGPHIYKISVEDDFAENHGALAQARHTKTAIIIDPAQSASQMYDSLLHEILHCINNQVEFAPKDRELEEQAVSRLAPMLLMLIEDNPELFKGGGSHGRAK